jgi:5-methyltetrahydrofolate--homocysteine methyltransferase
MSRFLDALHSGRVLLMDGAMGTELQHAGIRDGECYELWNRTHPDRVRAIHQAYAEAGARCLLTNSFQANPAHLAIYGLERDLDTINAEAIALARSAGGASLFVLASVGPFPPERVAATQVLRSLRKADAFLLETWSTPPIMDSFPWKDWAPVLLSLTWDGSSGLRLVSNMPLGAVAEWAHQSGVVALGVNCGRDVGMDEIIEIVPRYRQVTDLPLFARPNAGTPTRVGDRWVYPHTPEEMAARLPELLERGVSMVGGCCGTTPEHIAAFRRVIDEWNARHR